MVGKIISLYLERWDFFLELLLQHIGITLVSVLIISVIGLFTGILMTRNETFASIMLIITNFVYTIPSIALFGVLVTITGIGNKSAVTALVIYGLLPIIKNTYVGIKEVDSQIIESAIGMGTTSKQLLFRIQLPLALPFIGAGGLGVAIYRGISTYNQEMIIAGSLLVAFLAIFVDLIIQIFEKRLRKRLLGKQKRKEVKI